MKGGKNSPVITHFSPKLVSVLCHQRCVAHVLCLEAFKSSREEEKHLKYLKKKKCNRAERVAAEERLKSAKRREGMKWI